MSFYRNVRFLAILLTGAFILQGCDWIAEKAGIDKVDVSFGSAGANLTITPDGADANTGTVNLGDQDLPNVFEVESITVTPDDVTFTPTAGKTGDASGSGTIDVFILIDQVPAYATVVTVTGDIVTGIDPRNIRTGVYNQESFAACLARFGSGQGPALRQGYESLSQSQRRDIVKSAVDRGSFPVTLMICAHGDVSGYMTITEATFNLDF